MHEFIIHSRLAVPPEQLVATTSMQSVNWELAPVVRMTAPAAWRNCPVHQWESGRVLSRSWILLFGFIPVDLHSFCLQAIYPGAGFQENSSSLVNLEWRHRRMVVAQDGGCMVTDHLRIVGRIPVLSALLMPVYRFVLQHRHRRLRSRFGDAV